MMERLKYKLNEFNSKADVNKDFYVKPSFFGDQKLIPPGEINHIVDVGEHFNKERQASKIYRIQGTISPLFSNPLMNMKTVTPPVGDYTTPTSSISESGNGLDIFNGELFTRDPFNNDFVGAPDLTFEDAFRAKLKEKDGWFGFYEPDARQIGVQTMYQIEPTSKQFDLSSYNDKNWELTITYPYAKETDHVLVRDGLLTVGAEEVEVGGVPMMAISTSTYHGLINGDRVNITNTSGYDGQYTVLRLGLDNGDFKDNYFCINVDPTTVTSGAFTGNMKKVISGYESEYYIRKFKKLLTVDNDYEMYQLAFSNNIFNDPNYQFVINEDLDITDLEDNLGRPLSELYLTMVKTDSNTMFHKVQSGFDLEYIPGNLIFSGVSNSRLLTYDTTTSHTPLYDDVLIDDNEFYGDVVEYNVITVKETVLSDVLHRFNTTNREIAVSPTSPAQGPRREGYLYKPHHLIQIRDYSIYVEQGDKNTGGIPSYAEDLGDGRWLWRDLLDIGMITGDGDLLDYPFTNGVHYIHQNYCFKTMRQDPFSAYGLYYFGSAVDADTYDPSDPIGDPMTDEFTIKISDNVC